MVNIGFSLIGTPDGFDILNGGVNKALMLNEKIDFKNRLISIFPNSEIYLFFRELVDNSIYYHFVYYRYAQEIMTNRPGAFYGSVITLQNAQADPKQIISSLQGLADVIKQYCLSSDSKFKTKISSLTGIQTPSSLLELSNNLQEFEFTSSPISKKGYIQTNEDTFSVEELFYMINEDSTLDDFNYIYASDSLDVLQSVKKKETLDVISLKELRLKHHNEYKFLKQEYDQIASKYKALTITVEQEISKNNLLINEKSLLEAKINEIENYLYTKKNQYESLENKYNELYKQSERQQNSYGNKHYDNGRSQQRNDNSKNKKGQKSKNQYSGSNEPFGNHFNPGIPQNTQINRKEDFTEGLNYYGNKKDVVSYFGLSTDQKPFFYGIIIGLSLLILLIVVVLYIL